jgi:predicted dehydrogenase
MTVPTVRLRTAVVGTGFVGPFHVDAVRRGGYADVVAIAGSDAERTEARAASLGVERGTTDVDALLRDTSIDVIHVCTPNRTHVEIATAAIRAGKHVVVEKPVALELAEAQELARLAREHGRHAAVAYTYRGYPMVRRARALVRDGMLGSIRLIHGGYVQDWLAGPQDYNWRLEPEISGASRAVADIGSHWFDTAEHVSGLRVESVFADLATFIPFRRRPAAGSVAFGSADGSGEMVEVRSEDAATILVRFEGGARGACVISQVSPGRKNAFGLELAGSDRTLEWHQEDPEHLWLRDREESRLLTRGPADAGGVPGPGRAQADWPGVPSLPSGHPEGWAEALRDMLRPFYAAVASGQPPPGPSAEAPYPTVDDGARGLAFVEAVMASARTERWAPVTSANAS